LQPLGIRAAGEAVNAVTPTAYLGGEPLKAWLLKRHGVSLVPGLASVLVSKTALMLTQGAFVFLGLAAPLGMTFSLLRRGRELLWVGFGLTVLIRRHALGWLRGRHEADGLRGEA
jgi:hypothetical protein